MDKNLKKHTITYDKSEIRKIKIDMEKKSKQTKIIIQNIEIYFPYQPYESQILYMTKVIEALDNKSIAALESPTGTGKTLCLLCASLAWLQAKRQSLLNSDEKRDLNFSPPIIYYSTRTHSQISNVIKELKKTIYLPSTVILASRDSLCVNQSAKVATGQSLNIKCKVLRHKKECSYYTETENLKTGEKVKIMDIEELYSFASQAKFCPYYYQRNRLELCDIIFLPYNYIFDPTYRKAMSIDLEPAILIVDEAHNIASSCEDSKSIELSYKIIEDAENDLKSMKKSIELVPSSKLSQNLIQEQENILNNIKSYLKTAFSPKGSSWPNIGEKISPEQLFNIIFEGSRIGNCKQMKMNSDGKGITPQNLEKHIETFKNIESEIIDNFSKTTIISKIIQFLEVLNHLYKNYMECKKNNKTTPDECFIKNYKLFIQDEEIETNYNFTNKLVKTSNEKNRLLSLYCFNPGFGFKDVIDQIKNGVIITSGTLSPMDGLESELKCKFAIKLENTHVIDKNQVRFNIIPSYNVRNGNNIIFKFDMANRENVQMKESLGKTIVELSKITPGGILVFFTAYGYMRNCYNLWVDKKIIIELEKYKTLFQDVQDSNKNKLILESFRKSILKNKKGSILFSVLRGTCSEGLDFADDLARMVIVVGIPFPSLGDVKVQLKKEFLNEIYNNPNAFSLNKKISSNDWYTEVAIRAVNQALGRVIRHVDDFGSMVLIDQRFVEMYHKKVFSNWLRELAVIYDSTAQGDFVKDNYAFYQKMNSFIREKRIKQTQSIILNNPNLEEHKSKDVLIIDKANAQVITPEYNLKRANVKTMIKSHQDTKKNEKIKDLLEDELFKDISCKKKQEEIITKSNNVKLKILHEFSDEQLRKTAEMKKKSIKNNHISNDEVDDIILTGKVKKNESFNHRNDNFDDIIEIGKIERNNKLLNLNEKKNKDDDDKFNNVFEMLKNCGEDEINKIFQITSSNIYSTNVENKKEKNYECPVCYSDSSTLEFKSGKCGHIVCNECWTKLLKVKIECPVCKGKIRETKLKHEFI